MIHVRLLEPDHLAKPEAHVNFYVSPGNFPGEYNMEKLWDVWYGISRWSQEKMLHYLFHMAALIDPRFHCMILNSTPLNRIENHGLWIELALLRWSEWISISAKGRWHSKISYEQIAIRTWAFERRPNIHHGGHEYFQPVNAWVGKLVWPPDHLNSVNNYMNLMQRTTYLPSPFLIHFSGMLIPLRIGSYIVRYQDDDINSFEKSGP